MARYYFRGMDDLNGKLQTCQTELDAMKKEAGKQKELYLDEMDKLATTEMRKDRDIKVIH